MTYDPTVWVDYGIPCIEAATLNNAEDGIDRAQGDVMVLRGLTANIPVTDPLLVGRLYFETDLLERGWRDNGAGWDLVTVPAPYTSLMLATGEISAYFVGGDGDVQAGVAKSYTPLIAGDYALTSDIEVAHYAGNQISFTLAGSVVADVAAGLVTFLAGDTVVIKGSALNDGVYTVAVGGVAGQFTTVQALVNEAAGAVVSLYKRTAHSNNAVDDDNNGLQWSRNDSRGELVGPLSNGLLNWYDVATVFTLHGAAADLSIVMPGNILRIVGGAGEVNAYHVGDLLDCAGFANAVNNLPGYYVESVTVNGADLDIVLDPSNQTLVAEVAGGARSIGLVTRSCFNYAAGARLAPLSNLTDWRVPNDEELPSIRNMEVPSALPDAVAFPGWWASFHWTSTSRPTNTTMAASVDFSTGQTNDRPKTETTISVVALVRLGI